MKLISLFLPIFLLYNSSEIIKNPLNVQHTVSFCSSNFALEKPTEDVIIKLLKDAYEYTTKAGDVYKIDIQKIKIGTTQTANLKQELEGIPKGGAVTNVQAEYQLSGFITAKRIQLLWVYKNEFGDWKFKGVSTKTIT